MRIEKTNFRNKQRKNEKDKLDNKSKLLEKMKKEKIMSSSDNIELENIILDDKYKKLYKQIKKELENLKKEYAKIKNESLNEKSQKNQKNDIISELKIKIHDQYLSLDKFKRDKEELTKVLKGYETEINVLRQNLDAKAKELNSLSKNYDVIVNKVKNAETSNNALRKKLDYYKNDYIESIKIELNNKNDEIEKLKHHNKKIKQRNLKLEEINTNYLSLEPKVLLSDMYDKLSVNNFYNYHNINDLYRKYRLIKKKFYLHKNENYNAFDKVNLHGYIKFENEEFIFYDLNGNSYRINKSHNVKFNDEDVVYTFLNEDNSVDIIWRFDSPEEMNDDISFHIQSKQRKQLNVNMGETSEEYEQFGNFKVIVVTSKFGTKYSQRLKKHGVNATYIDAYEKSPTHVKESMLAADIVLMCVDSMPHLVNKYVEENNDKFQFLINHNEEIIVVRTRYTAELLGLL